MAVGRRPGSHRHDTPGLVWHLRPGHVAAAAIATLLAAGPLEAACTLSTTSVNFGTYDVFASSPLDSNGTVRLECGAKDTNITVTLGKGGASSYAGRRMLNGSEELGYQLYLDASLTTIWGDGTEGTGTQFVPTAAKGGTTFTVYGRVPAGQDVSAGSYSNTIVVTAIW